MVLKQRRYSVGSGVKMSNECGESAQAVVDARNVSKWGKVRGASGEGGRCGESGGGRGRKCRAHKDEGAGAQFWYRCTAEGAYDTFAAQKGEREGGAALLRAPSRCQRQPLATRAARAPPLLRPLPSRNERRHVTSFRALAHRQHSSPR